MTALPDLSVETHRIPFARTDMGPDAVAAAARVLASGWVTTGPEVVDFEREFAAHLGLRGGTRGRRRRDGRPPLRRLPGPRRAARRRGGAAARPGGRGRRARAR